MSKCTPPAQVLFSALRAGASPTAAEARLREMLPEIGAEELAEAFAQAAERLIRTAADRRISLSKGPKS